MIVPLIFKTPLMKETWLGQWDLMRDASKDISGRHEMKLSALEIPLS
jgi:hypothetical protein